MTLSKKEKRKQIGGIVVMRHGIVETEKIVCREFNRDYF